MNPSTEITKMSSVESLNGQSNVEWLNLHEFAAYVGVSERTVSQWYKENNSVINCRMVPNPHGGKSIRLYAKDSTNGKLIAEWLAKNQLHKARNSSVGSAAVEYVTKEAFNLVVQENEFLRQELTSMRSDIQLLLADNKKLHEQISQLLEAPKSQALPAPKSEFANGPLLLNELSVPKFFKALDFPLELQNPFYTKPSPLKSGRICNDDFPLKTVSAFRVYVRYVVSQGMSEVQRLDWIQTHPSWAQKIGY